MYVLDSAPSGSVGTACLAAFLAAPHLVLKGGLLFVSLFGTGAVGAVVPDVASGTMSPAVSDWITVAVGALGIWFLAVRAPVVDLFLEFFDFTDKVIEGGVGINGIRGSRGGNRRSGVVGICVSVHPGLKNGVHFVFDEVFDLVGAVSCSAGGGCILATVVICVGEEGLEVGPSAISIGLVPPLLAVIFEEACFLDNVVALAGKLGVVDDFVAACSKPFPFRELFVESLNGGGRVPVGVHAALICTEVSLCDLAVGVPEVGEELERRDLIVAGDVVCQRTDVLVFDVVEDHVSELGTSVGERDELVLCELMSTDRFGDLRCCCSRGMGWGNTGVGGIDEGGVGVDAAKIWNGNDQSDPAKIWVGGTGNGQCLFADSLLKLHHGGVIWLTRAGTGHLGHLVRRDCEHFSNVTRCHFGITHCEGRRLGCWRYVDLWFEGWHLGVEGVCSPEIR